MCGISGVIKKGSISQELENIVSRINSVQNRRGPDDRGVFVDEKFGLALGHTRLSILDLSPAGHQPMSFATNNRQPITDNKKLWMTFNGEIYNFGELRDELKKFGHQFKTKTDTEVILASYAEWGVESFSKLRGMFAFGLWDSEQRKLYLVKDRYGIKPLYYFSGKESFVFASTVKALKASGMVPDKKNNKASIGFLLFGSVPLPHTTMEDIHGIPAGHYLVRDLAGDDKLVKYYEPLEYFTNNQSPITNNSAVLTSDDLRSDVPRGRNSQLLSSSSQEIRPPQINFPSVQDIAQHIRSLLEESVRLHMISDAPLGVFLSGGVDSSALSILASKVRKNPVTTVSITFDEDEYTEKKYQDIIARQIKSDHHEYKVTRSDFEDSLTDIWDAMDQPTIDGINTYFVAQAAKKAGLKTVLSGLGADEIFFGYQSFRRAAMLRKVQKGLSIFGHRKSAQPSSKDSAGKVGFAMSQILRLLPDRYAKLDYLRFNDPLRFYLSIRGLFTPGETAKILDISEREVNDFIDSLVISYGLSVIGLRQLHPANLLSYLELKFYLQNQLLKDSDFMAMHHSIEIRVPFLDNKLVEYVSRLPAELKLNPDNKNSKFKIKNSRPKPLLIAATRDILPQEVWDRAKMGFTFPFQDWFSALSTTHYKLPTDKMHWSRRWALSVLDKLN